MRLQSLQTLASDSRISSVDIFRSIAILTVIFYHFQHYLKYGFLGVDLFFVISGLLVGGLLTKQYKDGTKVNFFKFFLQRGFKIWPSLFTFLIIGNIIAYTLFIDFAPEQYIPFSEIWQYVFFIRNYILDPPHWSFDHLWSLCVEEHFYIILPIAFILLQKFRKSKKALFITTAGLIVSGTLFKILSVYLTETKDTYFATHNRIDALGWGVLLTLIVQYYPEFLKKISKNFILFFIGLAIFLAAIKLDNNTTSVLYKKIIFFSLAPFSFFLMLAGVYYFNFSKLKPLRFIAYYSYNWYLWHPLFAIPVIHFIGANWIGLAVYMGGSFVTAMFFTILIEERFLKVRNQVIPKLFPKKNSKEVSIEISVVPQVNNSNEATTNAMRPIQ